MEYVVGDGVKINSAVSVHFQVQKKIHGPKVRAVDCGHTCGSVYSLSVVCVVGRVHTCVFGTCGPHARFWTAHRWSIRHLCEPSQTRADDKFQMDV